MTVLEQVRQHKQIVENITGRQPLVTVLFGSQNYGLETEQSDVDTRSCVARSLEEFILNKERISSLYVFPDNSHAEYKDLQLFLEVLSKQNPSFLEVLFSKYMILKPSFYDMWHELETHREEIAHASPKRFYEGAFGLISQKCKNLTHISPSTNESIMKYGYDTKNLCHLIRMYFMMVAYSEGKPFQACLDVNTNKVGANLCWKAKRGEVNLEEAQFLADHYYNEGKKIMQVNEETPDSGFNIQRFFNDLLLVFYEKEIHRTLG